MTILYHVNPGIIVHLRLRLLMAAADLAVDNMLLRMVAMLVIVVIRIAVTIAAAKP